MSTAQASSVQAEIAALEEQLRQAEVGPDAKFFETHLADNAVLISQDGHSAIAKSQIVQAHRPGAGPKFTRVEMSDMTIIDHGTAAVVTCKGVYEGPQGVVRLKFMRVWLKTNNQWQIVAGSIS